MLIDLEVAFPPLFYVRLFELWKAFTKSSSKSVVTVEQIPSPMLSCNSVSVYDLINHSTFYGLEMKSGIGKNFRVWHRCSLIVELGVLKGCQILR